MFSVAVGEDGEDGEGAVFLILLEASAQAVAQG